MSFTVIIPARFESSRLPGKPLKEMLGHPMIYWTWQQAIKAGASRVVIATENQQVFDVCQAFGAEVCMTLATHESGTERIAEVIDLLNLNDDDIIVNVQGDEPMLPPSLIKQVAQDLIENPSIPMATLCEAFDSIDTLFDPNTVKVSRNANQCAITFSRAPLPWSRDTFADEQHRSLPANWVYQRHIGLYAYRAGFVKQYVAWEPCELEQVEKLEQLRVLWYGENIRVLNALCDAGVGVDTPQDLERAIAKMTKQSPHVRAV